MPPTDCKLKSSSYCVTHFLRLLVLGDYRFTLDYGAPYVPRRGAYSFLDRSAGERRRRGTAL